MWDSKSLCTWTLHWEWVIPNQNRFRWNKKLFLPSKVYLIVVFAWHLLGKFDDVGSPPKKGGVGSYLSAGLPAIGLSWFPRNFDRFIWFFYGYHLYPLKLVVVKKKTKVEGGSVETIFIIKKNKLKKWIIIYKYL